MPLPLPKYTFSLLLFFLRVAELVVVLVQFEVRACIDTGACLIIYFVQTCSQQVPNDESKDTTHDSALVAIE
jgi:hypothetical protein